MLPVETDPGVFDDRHEEEQRLWGIYGTGPLRPRGLGVDLYYIGTRRPDAEFEQGVGRELRHTVGTRLFGERAAWGYNFEVVYQRGRFAGGGISAWTAASDTGYTLDLPARPRLGMRADMTSGDRDPGDGDLETFNPLFPKGNYFGEASLVGPMNHVDIHPSVAVQPAKSLVITVDWLFFWRQSAADGLYRVSGAPQVPAAGISDQFVGSQPELTLEWAIDRHVDLVATYSRFYPGGFLKRAGLGSTVEFFAAWVAYRL